MRAFAVYCKFGREREKRVYAVDGQVALVLGSVMAGEQATIAAAPAAAAASAAEDADGSERGEE